MRGPNAPHSVRYAPLVRWREDLLEQTARSVVRHRWLVLLTGLALAGAALTLVAARLEFRTDRSELVDPSLPWNARYAAFKRDFPHWDDLIVVIAGDAEDPAIDALARDVAESLAESPRVSGAFAGFLSSGQWIPNRRGDLRLIAVALAQTDAGGIDGVREDLAWLRSELGDELDATAGIEWGVTGLTAIESDETTQSIHDSTRASIIAFVLITALMLGVFRGVATPLLAAGTLLVGLSWSFGWLVIAVGHLQLLSVVFTVILLGLGVDFALHIVVRLELVRSRHEALSDALSATFRAVGPGLLTGAITTAVAFGSTAFTDFRGMAEMGIIAAGGIVLCLLAMLLVFPAALAVSGRWRTIIRDRAADLGPFAGGRLDVVDRHPGRVVVLAITMLVVAGGFATTVRYDPNVLNLQAPGVESVIWEDRLVAADAGSAWAARIVVDAADVPDMAARLAALPEVAQVGGAVMLREFDDPPAELIDRWTADQRALLTAEPTRDPAGRSILDPDRLRAFVTSVRTVAPDALGPPIQIHESSRLIVRAYIRAALLAITVILILLVLDYRSLADALAAMTPVTAGFVGMFGFMGATGTPLNFANIIVLPLIFGIGVDAGVHIVHRWRLEPAGRPAGLAGGTGRGVLLTLVTTTIGFAGLIGADHRGIRSLGVTMVAGLLITLVAAMTLLPAILRLRRRPMV